MNIVANRFRSLICKLAGTVAVSLFGWNASAAPAPKLEFSAFDLQLAQGISSSPGLAAFYGANGLRPVFTGDDSSAEARRQALIAAMRTAPAHGLPASRYGAAELESLSDGVDPQTEARFARALALWSGDVGNGLVDPRKTDPMNKRDVIDVDLVAVMTAMLGGDPAKAIEAIAPRSQDYLRLKAMLGDTVKLVVPSHLAEITDGVYKPGSRGPGVAELRDRLASIGFTAGAADPTLFDDALADALSRYQDAAGLPADGVAGPQTIGRLNGGAGPEARRLMIAMERMRWLNGHDLSARHIWVNVPSFMAEIRDAGETEFETRVVVGKPDPDWETPEFSDVMEFVVPNPRWNVPQSIAAASYLGKLRANPNALSHLDVVDRNGRIVPRSQVDFNRYSDRNFPYRLRQKPSADNALGLVKFMFPNPWNIYLHDTPSKSLFGNRDRASSHGCVRIGDPFDLAYRLLRGNSDDPQALFQRMLDTGEEKWIKLKEPLPIHLVYFTAIPSADGRLRTYRDVYGRDALVWQAMQKASQPGS